MMVATYNINGINARLRNLVEWLRVREPDVICLQETKCPDADFPAAALERLGYRGAWRGKGGHAGVALLARDTVPVVTHDALPGDAGDTQPRYLEAAVDGVLVATLYAPNGNPQPGPKFAYKLAWNERLIAHAAQLRASKFPIVLAGDYNIVPTDADIYAVRSYRDNALLQPEPRAQYARLLLQGWSDALRTLHPDTAQYTFWAYLRNAWPRDAGLRIDHVLVSALNLVSARVDREVRGVEGASDHVPVVVAAKP